MKYHVWVNIEKMLAKCYIGPLMDNTDAIEEEEEDEDSLNEGKDAKK